MMCACEVLYYSSVHLLLRKSEEPEQRSLPSVMMAIRSPRMSASSLHECRYRVCFLVYMQLPDQKKCLNSFNYMKCVVNMIVRPSLYFSSKSQVALLAYGSIPEVGSSSITTSDPPIKAIPTLQEIVRLYVVINHHTKTGIDSYYSTSASSSDHQRGSLLQRSLYQPAEDH